MIFFPARNCMRNYLCAMCGYDKRLPFVMSRKKFTLHIRGAFGCKRISFFRVGGDDGGGPSIGGKL
jgi:hypothetical protein